MAVALVWIVIRMVSRCRERTSLRTAQSDREPNTENDVNTKALAKNDDAEQSQAGTKAVIEEEKEEPSKAMIEEEKEEPSKAERKQIEDDGGAGKRSQAEEGGRKSPGDGWLSCIVIVIAITVLLVITWLASLLLGPAHGGAGQRDPLGWVHYRAGQ
jgi:cobalamin biosynthesis Mg chelatase CobN